MFFVLHRRFVDRLLECRQAVIAAVFDHDLESARGSQAVDRRRTHDVHNGVFHFFFQLLL